MSNGNDGSRAAASGGNLSQTPYLIVLLALLGLMTPRALSPPGNTPPASTTISATAGQSPGESLELTWNNRLQRMIGEVLGRTDFPRIEPAARHDSMIAMGNPPFSLWLWPLGSNLTAGPSDWQQLAKGAREFQQSLRDASGNTPALRFLIATIHDPVDSHLQTYFDSDLASMQRAIQRHGFIMHRFWLPWQEWIHQTRDLKAGKSADKRVYEREPAILLFRRTRIDAPPDVVVLFLVGETPTGGVHVEAFRTVLDTVTAWGGREIRIIGPSASGTSFSLKRTLTSWHRTRSLDLHLAGVKRLDVHFVTGSATNNGALQELASPSGDDQLVINVRATVLPDSVVTHFMFKHLIEDRGIAPYQIAVLTEADTSYGRIDLKSEGLDILTLPYQMEIGTLRNEYEKVDALKFGPQQPTTVPRMNLEVPWEQPRDARDVVPLFSDTTPAVTERRLATMLLALGRRDIRAIGLLGTDPKDLLFLSQQIRRFCPNVQLFTFENNILYTHPDYVRYLKGTVVASTYPLMLNSQDWNRLSAQRVGSQFSSSTSQGIHNAALAQMERLFEQTESSPAAKVRLREYASPFDAGSYGSPPLWLSIVGQNTVSPIEVIPRASYNNFLSQVKSYEPKNKSTPAEAAAMSSKGILGPPPFTLGSLFISGVVFSIAALFLRENLAGVQRAGAGLGLLPGIFPWLNLNRPAPFLSKRISNSAPAADGWRHSYAVTLFGGLAAFQLLSTSIVLFSAGLPDFPYINNFSMLLIRGFSIATFVLCLVTSAFVVARWSNPPDAQMMNGRKSMLHFAIMVLSALVVGAVIAIALPFFMSDAATSAVRVERWGDLFNGVTPIVPLTCMATIPVLWSFCQLRRSYLLRIHRLGRPFLRGETLGLARRLSELNKKLKSPWWRPSEFRDWILLIGLVTGGVLLVIRWINTADSPTLDWLMFVFGIINVALIYSLHVRFMAVSGLLERFLRRLAQTNLADAFEKVPNRLKRKAAGQIFAAGPHPGDLSIVIRQLEEVVRVSPFHPTSLNRLCKAARDRFNQIDSRARGQRTTVYEAMESVNRPLRAGCRQVSCELVLKDRTKISRRRIAKAAGNPPSPQAEWEAEARVFVATQITTLLRQTFAQIQNLLTFLMLMLLMLIWAIYSYPFQPQRFINLCLIGLALWMIVSTVYIFIKFNRNEILSYLSDTTPNRFTPDISLFRQLLVFGVVPFLSLLALQFPEVGNIFFFWVDGLQKAFR